MWHARAKTGDPSSRAQASADRRATSPGESRERLARSRSRMRRLSWSYVSPMAASAAANGGGLVGCRRCGYEAVLRALPPDGEAAARRRLPPVEITVIGSLRSCVEDRKSGVEGRSAG